MSREERLAVMAHYDPRGSIGPHVRRQVEALAEAFDDLVVVSTANLQDRDRAWLRARGELIERANYGYDFYSYRTGLASRDLSRYDEVVICNDSYVGPLRSYSEILDEMAKRPVDFWGLTETDRVRHHVQSFFVAFRPWTVSSAAFRRFWDRLEPLPDRRSVILNYEVGLSTTLYDAGFGSGAYFRENEADRLLARRRVQWWAEHRWAPGHRAPSPEQLRAWRNESWNAAAALADRAFDAGRLPYVKIDTLRYDPYGLGSDRLLRIGEARFPAEFEGVRAFLDATGEFYSPRPDEVLRPPHLRHLARRRAVQYRAPRHVRPNPFQGSDHAPQTQLSDPSGPNQRTLARQAQHLA